MTDIEPKADSKSKPVEVWTLILVAMSLLGTSAKFVLFDWRLADLDRREKEIKVAKDEAESVYLTGEVLTPDLHVASQDDFIPVCPVLVHIHNEGQSLVELEDIEFRVLVASLEDIAVFNRVETPKEGIALASSIAKQVEKPSTRVGIIDYNSAHWKEHAELCRSTRGTLIQPGQVHTERFHLLSPTLSPFVTKVDVTVKTKQSRKAEGRQYQWSGFANRLMCQPALPGEPPLSLGQ